MKKRIKIKFKFTFLLSILIIMGILSISLGYSTFFTNLEIDNQRYWVRLNRNIRVTNTEPYSSSNAAILYEEYNEHTLAYRFKLDSNTSSVTYKVEVTNFGNTIEGIFQITGLPTDLTYELNEYTLKNKICDNSGNCISGAKKEFYITIKYANQSITHSNTDYEVLLEIDFRPVRIVTLDPTGGIVSPSSKDIMYGDVYGTLPIPSRDGYIFQRWTYGSNEVIATTIMNVNSDHTLLAEWIPGTFTAYFNPDGGSVSLTSKIVTYGKAYGDLPTPTKSYNDFDGWYDGVTLVTSETIYNRISDVTLIAKWKPVTYTITFDNNGGSGCISQTQIHGNPWGSLCQPNKPDEMYEFGGWFNGNTEIFSSNIAVSNLSVTAKWIISKCKVIFDANGGTLAVEDTVKYIPQENTTYGSMPLPMRDGYSFVGWYTSPTDGTLIVNNSNVGSTTSITLYAHWEKIEETPWTGDPVTIIYTKKIEKVTLPPGKYYLDVYGGQGGKSDHGVRGGYGGHSYGYLTLTEETDLYLAAGGAGATASGTSGGAVLAGAWNGGGNGAQTNSDSAGGGSASHIAFIPGLLYQLEGHKDQIIIVAGGGGGSGCSSTTGGEGGGLVGTDGTGTSYHAGAGGTQYAGGAAGYYSGSLSENGSFGLGGSTGTTLAWPGAGGGGGWYGGGAGANEPGGGGSGGGGSGYVNTSYLTGAVTEQSTHTGDGSITITKVA